MEYTTNYHLPQWVETDRIMMGDFNQMCSDIDEGIAEAKEAAEAAQAAAAELPYVVGSYTGDGTTTNRTINLGFKPKLVIITGTSRSSSYEAEALTRFALIGPSGASGTIADMTSTGFVVKNSGFQYPQLNVNGCAYAYVAFK